MLGGGNEPSMYSCGRINIDPNIGALTNCANSNDDNNDKDVDCNFFLSLVSNI